MTYPQTTILLLGAGELGSAFLPHLSALPNAHITIGIRSPSKYTHLQSPNISLTAIDLTSPSLSLAKTFSTYDILISATGFGADPSSVLKLAEEALLAGKIRKEQGKGKLWFFPWQWGVDYDVIGDGEGMMPLFGAQRDVRNLLRRKAEQSNVKWTVRVGGKQVQQEAWSIEHLKEELDSAPEDGIKKYRLVFARDGVWWEMSRTVNKALGMNMMDVETFTRSLFSR
ncbi:uncharacterized protein J4E87_009525 [Alternaria ethzedia]|uniref:uncharacterized protein n=1 Tax=Alternaria ethzedia TaxID=181014 RepID=UPI0020C215F7|nr:uncharacterized protein J4E87_009525 [Alternaria ethzedia]KAI4614305.1 hypothetical protein J4E87_009525 [Alternaria ethzedia]